MPQPSSHAVAIADRAHKGDQVVALLPTWHHLARALDDVVLASRLGGDLGLVTIERANGRERLRYASGGEVTFTTHAQADRHLLGRRPAYVHAEGGVALGTLTRLRAAGVEVMLA